jgi:hypothetical protein
MRTLLLSFLTCSVIACLTPCAPGEEKTHSKKDHRIQLFYYVTGMEGQDEVADVTSAVKAQKSVVFGTVNTERGYVTLSLDSHEISYQQVAEAIAIAGRKHGKTYDPRIVITVADYSNPALGPKIKEIFAASNLKPWIKYEAIDEANGVFFIHFLPLVNDPNKKGTQGFNGGYIRHPVTDPRPQGLGSTCVYSGKDSPAIPVSPAIPTEKK